LCVCGTLLDIRLVYCRHSRIQR